MLKSLFFTVSNFGLGIALVLCSLLTAAQSKDYNNSKPYGILPEFVRNNTTHHVSEVASNVLRVINNTGKNVSFRTRFSIPMNWYLTRLNSGNYEILPGDSIFIPVRVIVDKLAKGNTNYVIFASLVSDKDVQFAAQNWYVALENQSSWSASIPLKKNFFINNSDSSGFSVRLQNTGNADEMIHLQFSSDRRVMIVDPSTKNIVSPRQSLTLPVGSDTTLTFDVKKVKATEYTGVRNR